MTSNTYKDTLWASSDAHGVNWHQQNSTSYMEHHQAQCNRTICFSIPVWRHWWGRNERSVLTWKAPGVPVAENSQFGPRKPVCLQSDTWEVRYSYKKQHWNSVIAGLWKINCKLWKGANVLAYFVIQNLPDPEFRFGSRPDEKPRLPKSEWDFNWDL